MFTTRSSLIERMRDPDDVRGWAEFDRLYHPRLISYARRRGLSGPMLMTWRPPPQKNRPSASVEKITGAKKIAVDALRRGG